MRKMFLLLATLVGAVAIVVPAWASPLAPTVTTGSAAAITSDTSLLGGTVLSNGAAATYFFQYGTSISYGSQTNTGQVGAAAGSKIVLARLKGLASGTLYHFRLVASNSAGTSDGSDQTFSTVALPAPNVVTGSALSVTERAATLSGTVDPGGTPTTYAFQYGATSSYGSQTPTRRAGSGSDAVAVTTPLVGLSSGTTYHYRLVATNSTGTTDGADQTFTTVAAAAPEVVTGTASSVTSGQAILAGTVTPNGVATMYHFEYGTSTSYGSKTSGGYAGSGTGSVPVSAHLFRLMAGQTFHYRLVATSSSGTTDGADQTFTTTAPSLPVVVTGQAVAVAAKSAALSGTIDPNETQTTYSFQYGATTGYGSQTNTRTIHANQSRTVLANINGLTPQTLYHYRLVATNSSGTTDGADATFTTSAATVLPHAQWFAGSVQSVGSSSVTVGVLWTGPHDGSLNGQTLTVAVPASTPINQAPHGTPIALASIQTGDLIAIRASGDTSSTLTASRIHVYCNCHWVGGTISAIGTSSVSVQVKRTGPYDTVLNGQNVTIQVNADTVYLHGPHNGRIGFGDLRVGEGVGVVFAADGFFKAPGFDPATATFTAKRIHVWGLKAVPDAASDSDNSAQVAVAG